MSGLPSCHFNRHRVPYRSAITLLSKYILYINFYYYYPYPYYYYYYYYPYYFLNNTQHKCQDCQAPTSTDTAFHSGSITLLSEYI